MAEASASVREMALGAGAGAPGGEGRVTSSRGGGGVVGVRAAAEGREVQARERRDGVLELLRADGRGERFGAGDGFGRGRGSAGRGGKGDELEGRGEIGGDAGDEATLSPALSQGRGRHAERDRRSVRIATGDREGVWSSRAPSDSPSLRRGPAAGVHFS